MTAVATPEAAVRSIPKPRVPLNTKIRIGLVMLAGFLVLAVSRPILAHTLWRGQWLVYQPVSGWDATITHPAGISVRHLLGTDSYGRDVFSMFSHSTWPTLQVALSAALVAGIVSTAFAAISAYRRGPIDGALTHLADALVLLPPPIALFIIGVSAPWLQPPILGALYGLLFGLSTAALVLRSQALVIMAKPFMEAARTAGGSGWWLIRVHVLPHLLPMTAVQMMAAVTGAVITFGFLEFSGAGGDWFGYGSLIYSGLPSPGLVPRDYAWNALIAGGLGITMLCGAFYLISVGLREAVDPELLAARARFGKTSRWRRMGGY
jgi:peptide/nickel transport system permease protein